MSSQSKIRAGFWLLTLATLVLGVVAGRNAMELAVAAQDVARTNSLVKHLEKLLSDLKDVEIAQREYLLTGDEQFVRHIAAAQASIGAELRQLATMRPEQRWLELLKTVIPQKFEEIERTVDTRRKEGVEAATALVFANRGQRAMDDIRRTVSNMIIEENRLLDVRSARQRSRFLTAMTLFALLVVLTLALIWYVFYLIRRESQRIRDLNADLERRVAIRTEALQQSNDDLQQFAYVASHDLKEPMRMISSYSSLLQRRYSGRLDSDADTYIGFIVDGVKRMNTLITSLLEYSRAGQSKDEQDELVDPAQILTAVLENLKVSIRESGARVTHDPLPEVCYDPLRLSQLLQNLIGNAIKYRGDRRPLVHISAQRTEVETIFSVRDNGMGIAPEHQDRIFAIFQRLHGKDIEGTGIGLAMCKKIVERHGGRLWLDSQPGKGSTFHFSVPHQRPATTEALESIPARSA